MTLFAVMLGGAVGSALRYGLALALNPQALSGMPWGTLAANITGCVLIGWLSAQLSAAPEPLRMGVLVGILGGFTTFSSFGLEAIRLFQAGHLGVAIAYVSISNLGGLLGAWIGLRLSS